MKVTEANTKMVREKLETGEPLLLEFYATWCPHCHRMESTVEDVAAALEGKISVWRIDGDQSMDLMEEWEVEGFPSFYYFENGKVLHKTAGEMSADALLNALKLTAAV